MKNKSVHTFEEMLIELKGSEGRHKTKAIKAPEPSGELDDKIDALLATISETPEILNLSRDEQQAFAINNFKSNAHEEKAKNKSQLAK